MKLFANITKRDDEQRMVWGYASTEALDAQGEVVKLDAIKGAWDDYMQFANIREMHQPSAVGKCKEYEFDDKGVQIGVKVVDDSAWAKVVEGVYTGFSIGGKAISKVDGIIKQLRLTEISLVDRPANPEALITVFKGEDVSGDGDNSQGNTDPAAEVEKGMWTAARMAEVLAALENVQMMMAYEEDAEGEGQAMPDELKAKVVDLVGLLARYVGKQGEEIANGTGKADGTDDLTKAGARFSKGTKAALAEVHGMLKKCDEALGKMGYAEAEEADDEAKADGAEDLAKMVTEKDAALADLAKVTADLDLAKADLAKADARIKELEAMPAPTAAPLNGNGTLSKNEDLAAGEQDPALADLQKKADAGELTAADVMKAIHSKGGRQLMV